MTDHSSPETPTRHNRDRHTAYERAHSDDTGYDFDACSCRHGLGIWPDIGDVESLTLLSGLTSTSSESDTA